MKKLFWLIATVLLLGACGGNEEPSPNKPDDTKKEEAEDVDFSYVPEETPGTDDPMEFGSKSNDEGLYVDGAHEIKIVSRYVNSETDEEGFNHVSFKGYEYTFAVLGVEDNYGEEMIVLAGETKNGTKDSVAFNSDLEIVTDNQEQAENQDAVGDSKQGVKQKAFITVPLEYGLPGSFSMTLQPPLKEVGEYQYEEGHYGDPIELEFTKE